MTCGLRLVWAGADPGKKFAAASARHAMPSSGVPRFTVVSYAGLPKPNKLLGPVSRRRKWRLDHRAVSDHDPDRGAPARPVEPFGLRLFRRRADESVAGPLARGLV